MKWRTPERLIDPRRLDRCRQTLYLVGDLTIAPDRGTYTPTSGSRESVGSVAPGEDDGSS